MDFGSSGKRLASRGGLPAGAPRATHHPPAPPRPAPPYRRAPGAAGAWGAPAVRLGGCLPPRRAGGARAALPPLPLPRCSPAPPAALGGSPCPGAGGDCRPLRGEGESSDPRQGESSDPRPVPKRWAGCRQRAAGRAGGSSPEEQSSASASAPELAPRDKMGETSGSCNTRLRGRGRGVREEAGARGSGAAQKSKPPHKGARALAATPQVPSDQGRTPVPIPTVPWRPSSLLASFPSTHQHWTGLGPPSPSKRDRLLTRRALRGWAPASGAWGGRWHSWWHSAPPPPAAPSTCPAESPSSVILGGLLPPSEAPAPGQALPVAARTRPARALRVFLGGRQCHQLVDLGSQLRRADDEEGSFICVG